MTERAVVCFVPVIHKGYLEFFKKHSGAALYVLGPDIIKEFPRLERDIRSLDPIEVRKALESLGVSARVELFTAEAARRLADSGIEVVMPDEDLTREVAARHLKGARIAFESVFLRWDKMITTKEHVVSPDRTISREAFDREMMAVVEGEAKKSSDWWRQNGAAAVLGGKVLLSFHNSHFPSDLSMDVYGDPRSNFDAGERFDLSTAIHAEAGLIAQAARQGIKLLGASMYMTTFPCPACAKSIAESGVSRIYYAKGYSLVEGEKSLKSHGIEIVLVQ